MLTKDGIDLNDVCFEELSRRQVSIDRAAHPVCVRPRPIYLLLSAAMGQRDFIDDVLRAAAVGERKNRDPLRCCLLVVGGYVSLERAGVKFDQVIEPGLSPVSVDPILV